MKARTVRTASLVLAAGAVTTVLTGCSGDVPMIPADDANNPACADVIVRLPSTVDGLDRRYTNAQSTGAWGDPASVLLYCGIEPSGPTTDSCVSVNGVDWIIDDSRAPMFRFEAYGRSPGLEVVVNFDDDVSGTNVITELSASVKKLPQERKCTTIADTIDDSQFGDAPQADAPGEEPAGE
ncbi:DUF3515 domain-containing protein [Leucobacter aridicollis]|uniref:DUF3515 domain-containing protein n=1 Tax=Leucobacter aridicollis TaxID=283878 RepID=UPI002168F7AB|nr:DUF3515 domain-containing protein [Leucobacter aridicollis]MCS3428120.1 hypothetical protein [Leucobacter aridicollis]